MTGSPRSLPTWRPGQSVTVATPASSANLGPGFDSIGVALGVFDRCTLTVTDEPGLVVELSGEGVADVPTDERHLVARTALHAWSAIGVDPPTGWRLTCDNVVPHGRGLGSSATAIVAGLAAALALAELAATDVATLDLDLVNDLAADLEGHPDNSSASVVGGVTISWTCDERQPRPDGMRPDGIRPTGTVRLDPHPDIEPVVFLPVSQLSTATARAVLPQTVTLRDAAANAGRAALLGHAVTSAPHLLPAATRDWLHQEPRRASYPESMDLVDRLRADGFAAVISGAGPAVLVLADRSTLSAVCAHAPAGWTALTPGFATSGVKVTGWSSGR